MIVNNKVRHIKKLQKESQFLKNILIFLSRLSKELPVLYKISCTSAQLNKEGSLVKVFVYSAFGKECAEEAIKAIIPYVPSMRGGLSQMMSLRYTPRIYFCYDENYNKVIKINHLLDKVSSELITITE